MSRPSISFLQGQEFGAAGVSGIDVLMLGWNSSWPPDPEVFQHFSGSWDAVYAALPSLRPAHDAWVVSFVDTNHRVPHLSEVKAWILAWVAP